MSTLAEKTKKDVRTEEEWLLQEISLLEKLKPEIERVLRLKANTNNLTKALDKNNVERVKVIHAQIEKDLANMPKLQRQLARGERRRVRYEKRALGEITLLQKEVEQPTAEKIKTVVERMNVYSARVLVELAWRVGKIGQLAQTENYELLEKHIAETLEAGKALVALIEQLQSLLHDIDAAIEKKKLTHSMVAEVVGYSGYIRDGIIKTAHVKSISALKTYLEKGIGKYQSNKSYNISYNINRNILDKFGTLIETNREQLRKVLLQEEIEQLKKIAFRVPEESVLLFLPGFELPVIVYNLKSLPDFSLPGWVFHALGEYNLSKVSKTGTLESPLETIIQKKHYYSFKFWLNEKYPQRLTDGISFSFQEYIKYQEYIKSRVQDPNRSDTPGGFFIFPLKNVLQPGLILDFRKTMDQGSEVCLRDLAYAKYNPQLVRNCLVALREDIPKWIDSFEEKWILFQEAKKNFIFFQELYESMSADDKLDIEVNEMKKEVIFSKYKGPSSEKKVIFTKQGDFYIKMKYFLRSVYEKEDLLCFIKLIKSNSLFEFVLATSGQFLQYDMKKPNRILPPITRFPPNQKPFGLEDTIFKFGIDFFNEGQLANGTGYTTNFSASCIILTFMKQQPNIFMSRPRWSTSDYLAEINKLEPNKLKKLFQSTCNELIMALDLIVKRRYRSEHPCDVDISKGVLFFNKWFSDKDTLDRLIQKKITIFAQFGVGRIGDTTGTFIQDQLDFFFKSVLPLNNFTKKGRFFSGSYLYIDSKQRLMIQQDDLFESKSLYNRIVRPPVLLE